MLSMDKISVGKFWEQTSKMPNKHTRDYFEHFDHNMPLPVVADKQLTYTIEGPKVYYNILLQLIALDEGAATLPGHAHKHADNEGYHGTADSHANTQFSAGTDGHSVDTHSLSASAHSAHTVQSRARTSNIHPDSPQLLRLIVDHIQIFERHWRKMVSDIRIGKLNKYVRAGVGKFNYDSFEGVSIPRPKLAQTLDHTFRLLGFHKKVLGKDIVTKTYAELRFKMPKMSKLGRYSFSTLGMMRELRKPTVSRDYTLTQAQLDARHAHAQGGATGREEWMRVGTAAVAHMHGTNFDNALPDRHGDGLHGDMSMTTGRAVTLTPIQESSARRPRPDAMNVLSKTDDDILLRHSHAELGPHPTALVSMSRSQTLTRTKSHAGSHSNTRRSLSKSGNHKDQKAQNVDELIDAAR
jgi:hypothetical protein